MNRAYLLIGGNMGDREALLLQAIVAIGEACGSIARQSAIYETAAWGKEDQPPFLNQVLELDTHLAPEALLQAALQIEQEMGRLRGEKYGPRLMDIDILLYNDAVVQLPQLTIPHPHMAARRFVLAPLAELVPHLQHPIHQISIQQLLQQCTDPLHVYKWGTVRLPPRG